MKLKREAKVWPGPPSRWAEPLWLALPIFAVVAWLTIAVCALVQP